MTILCHKTKMFPLIIAGVLRLWDGPLGCFSFCVQVERKQNFSRRLILIFFFKYLFSLFVCLLGFGGLFLEGFFYSDRAESQITAIMCQEESFLEEHPTACKRTESLSFAAVP